MPQTSTILVLEDEPIIALDIEDTLERGGFADIVMLRSCRDALEYLKVARPDAVLLDVHLSDGVCHAVAEVLDRMGIPFVVYSGLEPEIAEYADIFRQSQWLWKPALPEDLLAAVVACVISSKAA